MKKGFKRPPFSEEWKKKISESHKKNNVTPPSRKGAKMSQEARDKIAKSRSGQVLSEETKKKISLSRKGKFLFKHSPEAIEKIKLAGVGRKDTEETRIRKSLNSRLRGSKNPFWRGGITSANKQVRESLEYRLWRESVFKRDSWTCVLCAKKGYVEADHIKPFCDYIELRFELSNGRTLCKECHKNTDTYGKPKKQKTILLDSTLVDTRGDCV